ncbi:hypothetical protein, partial [Staphylococcus aureus]|uniref:hypothetical protein n=1 Tax=Staphylococcus aureus TaxID=1280 RepID=UPI0038B287C7
VLKTAVMRFLSFLLLFGLAAFAASAPYHEEWEWKSEVVERDINLKEGLNKILDMIRKHIDIDKIKEYIEERFKESKLREILLEKIERIKEKLK